MDVGGLAVSIPISRSTGVNERHGAKVKTTKKGQIRYAVVGLGYISQIAVLPAFAHARSNSRLTALVSGDSSKLKAMASKYNVKLTYSYEQYGDCLASGEIDAVYIALPNNMHRAYTEAAARAGVPVLCEKPMAMNESECEAMIAEVEREFASGGVGQFRKDRRTTSLYFSLFTTGEDREFPPKSRHRGRSDLRHGRLLYQCRALPVPGGAGRGDGLEHRA